MNRPAPISALKRVLHVLDELGKKLGKLRVRVRKLIFMDFAQETVLSGKTFTFFPDITVFFLEFVGVLPNFRPVHTG